MIHGYTFSISFIPDQLCKKPYRIFSTHIFTVYCRIGSIGNDHHETTGNTIVSAPFLYSMIQEQKFQYDMDQTIHSKCGVREGYLLEMM